MTESIVRFNDGSAYDQFMGRWSRAVGAVYLDWLAPPDGARWLDVGCGGGAFTELLIARCRPASIDAIDPSPGQIEFARQRPLGQGVAFHVGDAQALPFAAASFDVVSSALVINFIPDRVRALAEMRRVARPGAAIAGYVWDFAGGNSVNRPVARGLRTMGIDVPRIPGTDASALDALGALFRDTGLEHVETRPIEISRTFTSFDDFWQAQTTAVGPLERTIASLTSADRARLIEVVRDSLPAGADGSITYSSRAHAVKARAPR